MVRAPGTEKSEENPATIISPRPQTPATRKSFALIEPLAPGSRNSTPVYPDPPLLSRQHRPAGSNRTATRFHPSAHDARMRAPPLLRPKLGKNERARRISQITCRGKRLRQRRSSGPAETAVRDAASRVHAVAPVTIAPITAKTSRTRSDEVVSQERP